MLTITERGAKVATLALTESQLRASTVGELSAMRPTWAAGKSRPLGRVLAVALKVTQPELTGSGSASLGYGIVASFSADTEVTL